MANALSVPVNHGEIFVPRLIGEGKVDKSLRITKKDGRLLIPILPQFREICNADFQFRPRTVNRAPILKIREIAESMGINHAIPERWIRYGKSILLNTESSIDEELASVYARVLGVQKVYVSTGYVRGATRKPSVRLIFGTHGMVRHRENGVVYLFDPEQIMFSPGNVNVRGDLGIATENKVVIDFYSGIGYFSLPLAKFGNPSKVICVDINPAAIQFLEESSRANHLTEHIETHLGDSSSIYLDTKGDVAIMGHFDSLDMLENVLRNLKNQAIIVVHHLVKTADLEDSGKAVRLRAESLGRICKPIYSRIVKSYSPHVWHIVTAVEILCEVKDPTFG